IEHAIVETLMHKLKKAVKQTGITHVALSGGVSANTALRRAFEAEQAEGRWQTYIPRFSYTTDNAAMIAITGYYKYQDHDFCDLGKPAYARNAQ
ncbi:MAG: tRNA (adenosine(37)-N6)-threonylcarbamoyltransferase complex transferase subunit TsaD, partial [Bacteroidales bacterium]|nr:tRNA (adenosine(37)-N6)-threonylcarbamoyltransferase complex transferase subunit TsaD [Candidatus Equimonas enterica]